MGAGHASGERQEGESRAGRSLDGLMLSGGGGQVACPLPSCGHCFFFFIFGIEM